MTTESEQQQPHSPQAIGARIRHIRRVFNLTQKQAGEICGTGHSTIGNWELGLQKPTIAQAQRLGDRLGLTLDYIFLGRLGSVPLDIAQRLADQNSQRRQGT